MFGGVILSDMQISFAWFNAV